MIADLVAPHAHRPWCEDRDKPRSLDHGTTDGDLHCTSATIGAGPTLVYLKETSVGTVAVVIGGDETPIGEAVTLSQNIVLAVALIGGSE